MCNIVPRQSTDRSQTFGTRSLVQYKLWHIWLLTQTVCCLFHKSNSCMQKNKWRDINVQIMFSQSLRNKLWHIKLLWSLTFPWALNHYYNNKLLLYWTYWTYWQYKCITWMHCKSLWIKASAKCINVNVIIITNNVFLLLAAPGLQSGQIQLPLPARELLQWC